MTDAPSWPKRIVDAMVFPLLGEEISSGAAEAVDSSLSEPR
jgi:hypothetical protein